MTSWIYESPDGGKTIYRRVMGKHEKDTVRQIQVAANVWFSMDQLKEFGRQAYVQQCMRHEHPVLEQLWNDYQTMLRLLAEPK